MSEEVKRSALIDAKRIDVAMAIVGVKSDEELARLAGVTSQTIRNIRSTSSCSLRVLSDVASALDINPIDLLVTPGYPDPKAPALAVSLA